MPLLWDTRHKGLNTDSGKKFHESLAILLLKPFRLTFKRALRLNSSTLVLLNPDIPCLCKQCRSRSVGFWRSQLIWICTVCHQVCEFISTIGIKLSNWLKIRSGRGSLIYSAGQGLREWPLVVLYFERVNSLSISIISIPCTILYLY